MKLPFIIKKQKEKHHPLSDFIQAIGHILRDEDSSKLFDFRQHFFFNRFEHCINVARLSYRLAKWFGGDPYTCAVAGMLHDYHFTRIKSYGHATIAAQNAQKFGVSEEIIDIIRSHMYPFGRKHIIRAKGKNFWIVKVADFMCATFEMFYSIVSFSSRYRGRIRFKKNRTIVEHIRNLKP